MTSREDGRADDELRPVTITRNWLDHAAGSVLVEFGKTRVLCVASASEGVPRWRKGSGLGWVTAEYAMLPAATHIAALASGVLLAAILLSLRSARTRLYMGWPTAAAAMCAFM